MAEIKIEKKKPIWPWIVIILLIGAVIYFIYGRDNTMQPDNKTEIENTSSTTTTDN